MATTHQLVDIAVSKVEITALPVRLATDAPSSVALAARTFIGWSAASNPFELLLANQSGQSSQFQTNIESISSRAIELCRTQKWYSAEDHFHSAIWLAIADGDIAWCVEVGLKLAELYLAVNELDSVRALALQLIPVAGAHQLDQHALGLYTALAITPMLYSPGHAGILESTQACAELQAQLPVPIQADVRVGRFDRVLFQNVSTLLIAAHDEHRLHAWNWSWDQLRTQPTRSLDRARDL
jgi:hypothetical protein